MVVTAAGRQQAEIVTEGGSRRARSASDWSGGRPPRPPGLRRPARRSVRRIRRTPSPARGWASAGRPARAADPPDRVNGNKRVPVHVGPPPSAIRSRVKASRGSAIAPLAAIARAMCGRPTTAWPAMAATWSQLMSTPRWASRLTMARARGHAVVADPAEFRGEFRVVQVEQVRQQVHAAIGLTGPDSSRPGTRIRSAGSASRASA